MKNSIASFRNPMRWFFVIASLLFSAPAFAEVEVRDAWAPPSLKGSSTGVAYLTLYSASEDDALISVSSTNDFIVELHTHLHEDGIMRMRKLEEIALPKGEEVVLKPRGLHLMLYKLKTPLKEGTRIPLTLQFRHSPPVSTMVPISSERLRASLR